MLKDIIAKQLNNMTKEELIATILKHDRAQTSKILGIERGLYKVKTYMELFWNEGRTEETVVLFSTRQEAQDYIDNLEYADLEEVTGPSGMNYIFHIKVTYPDEGAEELYY